MAEYYRKKQPSCTTPDGREWFASGGGNTNPEYIEREAAVNICSNLYKECLRKSDWCGDTVAWNIGFGIKQLPAADVVPVAHGRWISLTECANEGVYCSVCNKKVYKADYAWSNKRIKMRSNYCPNCGARMDGE